MIWQNRLCKIEEGSVLLSAMGQWNDWNFMAPGRFGAVAIGFPADEPVRLEYGDAETLVIVTRNRKRYALRGNPKDGGRMDEITSSSSPPGASCTAGPA